MNLRRKLISFLASQKKTAEYTELDYLESTGTQWIDTGILFQPIKAVINLCFVESNTRELMGFGSYRTTYFGKTTDGLFELGGSYVLQGSNAYEWQEVTFTHNGLKTGGSGHLITKFGELTRTDNVTDTIKNGGFYLFNVQDYGTTVACRCKISSAKFYNPDTNKLIMDLIPVLDKDLVPCMYDKISGKYFYNQGTGEFKWRLPNQLEYLESTGTQWIDTGITPLIGDELELKNVQCVINSAGFQTVFSAGTGNYQTILLVNTPAPAHTAFFKYFATGGAQNIDLPFSLDNPTTIRVDGNGNIYYNDTFIVRSPPVQETDSSLRLFYRANNASPLTGKIGAVSIKRDGKFIINLIPVVKSDNTPCMFDLMSKKYLYNAGSGSFSYG